MSLLPDVIEISLEKYSTDCTVKKYNKTTKMSTVGVVKIEEISNIFSIQKPMDTNFIQNLLGINSNTTNRVTFFYYPSIVFDYSHYLYHNPLKQHSIIEFENHQISFNNETNILKITNVELKNNIAIIYQNSDGNIYKTFFGNYFNNNISGFISDDTDVLRYPLYNYYQNDTVCWPSGFDLNSYHNNFNKQSTLIYAYLNSVFNFDLNYQYISNNKRFFEKEYHDKIMKLVDDNFLLNHDDETVSMLLYILATGDEKLLFTRNSNFFNNRLKLSYYKIQN